VSTSDTGNPPAPATGPSDTRVLAALADGRDLAVLDIAQTTGLGRSTVGKALNRLAATGQATRTPSAGNGPTRTPKRWNPAPPTKHHATTPAPPATKTNPATEASPATEATPGAGSEPTTDTVQADVTTPTPDAASPPTPGTTPGGADLPTRVNDDARNPVTGTPKLAPGALTPLVAGHFAAHPATPLTAGEVGRALHRSGGAVRNACDRLVRDGDLAVASDSPRRYVLATPS
jgi:hypothetical protein